MNWNIQHNLPSQPLWPILGDNFKITVQIDITKVPAGDSHQIVTFQDQDD